MNPDVPNIKIKIPGDDERHDQTPPHVAVSHASSPDLVDKLWNSKECVDLYLSARFDEWERMRPIVEKDPNCVRIPLTSSGDRVLHVAANLGNTACVEELVKLMRPEDVLMHNADQMLPVHLAALSSHWRIVQLLCSDHLLDKMVIQDIEKLFFMTISNYMFDVAITLFEKHPRKLTFARDEKQLTSLHLLARMPYNDLGRSRLDIDDERYVYVYGEGMKLVQRIWTEVKKLKIGDILALTTKPSTVLSDVLETANDYNQLYYFMRSFAIITADSYGRNLLPLFDLPDDKKQRLLRAVGNGGNNVLHLAALLPSEFKSFSGLSAKIQMDKELSWFKDAERRVPDELKSMRNQNGKTPIEVFYDEHNQLSKDIKESAKGIADSGMVVATLVATVADSVGCGLLIISVAAMVVTFVAASFLIFDHTTKWVSYLVTPMGFFPLLVLILFQSKFCEDSY